MNRIDRLAIDVMLFNTCGEDPDILDNAEITEVSPNTYHITYALDNPYDAVDFVVKIERLTQNYMSYFKYTVTESVYGDDGEFTIKFA